MGGGGSGSGGGGGGNSGSRGGGGVNVRRRDQYNAKVSLPNTWQRNAMQLIIEFADVS